MKKIIAMMLVIVMLALVCVACGEKEPEYANMLEEIQGTGELHISLSPDFAPMEFVDTSKQGQDQYVGFDVTLAKYVAEQLGVELVIEPMSFEACQAAVSTKSVHMSISGYSSTPTRLENFNLSDGYYTGNEEHQVIITLKDNVDQYTSAEAFTGKVLSAQNASLQYDLLTGQLPDANANLITDLGVAVLEVIDGKVDGLCCAFGQAEIFCASYPELAICEWKFDISDDANVIMLPKGEDALTEKVNEILASSADKWAGWYAEATELAMSEFAEEVSIEDPAA